MKIVNREAYRDYEVLESVEAGVRLSGAEAKSVRDGRVRLGGGFVRLKDGEVWMVNVHIPRFKYENSEREESRSRKLLLHKSQIMNWEMKTMGKGITLVPLSMYTRGNLVKVEVGLVKGRREFEKREVIMKREFERNVEREFKNRSVKSKK